MASSPIDEVLEAARAGLDARRAEAAERVARIKAAADAYLLAIETEVANQFATRHGLKPCAPTAPATRAALDLRSLVDALPEALVKRESDRPVRTATPNPRYSTPPGEGRASRDRFEAVTLHPLVDELWRDVRAAKLDEMPVEVFKAHAEEFAARARLLQDTLPEPSVDNEALGRVIRTLTAIVSKRGISGVFGLSRSHTADWQARALEAARRRQQLLAGSQPADDGEPATEA